MLAFSSSPRFVDHDTGPHHPERPDRLRAVHRALRQAHMLTTPDPFPDFRIDLGPLRNPRNVNLLEIDPYLPDERRLTAVHTPDHVERVRKLARAGGTALDPDTVVSPHSFDLAKLAVGALLTCCDAVVTGRPAPGASIAPRRGEAQDVPVRSASAGIEPATPLPRIKRAFAAVRPPGHHAEPDRAMGFCLFNNIACAARHLQEQHGIGKLAIVDFDVHHGNGTQAAFESDATVLFISLHQHPRTCYPGTGYDWETGAGPGKGFTLNIPFNPGAADADYLSAMHAKVLPRLDQFKPEFLLISAGFDAHHDDPLADMNLSEQAFEQITDLLVDAANTHTQGRLVSALEGGYDLRALARSTVRHLTALAR